ncbi:Fic family protein [Bacillus sp. DJP31]|uniref:Fic family protein n=1 Tax=Bacillus sp. DJP31 TaxID=3409789 RepID=UPI003BB7FB5E
MKDYVDDILVRATHHSLAIENNTITLNETISILLHNTIPGSVSVREFYEVDNHRIAFNFLIQNLDQEFTLSILHGVHSTLLDRLHHERGRFKSQGNAIIGETFTTASPLETPIIMNQWVDNINYRIESALSEEEIIQAVCESHIYFERIHPYADGNGRTGRLLMLYLLLKNNIQPLIINKDDKFKYITFLAEQDVLGFTEYANGVIQRK